MSLLVSLVLLFSANVSAQTSINPSIITDKDWALEKTVDPVTQATLCVASTNKAQSPFPISLEVVVPESDNMPPQLIVKTQGLANDISKAYVRPSSKLAYPLLLNTTDSEGAKLFVASPLKTQELLKIIAEKTVFDIYFGTGKEAPLARLSLKGSENILKKAAACRPSKKLADDGFYRFFTKDADKATLVEGSLQDLTKISQDVLALYLLQQKLTSDVSAFEKAKKNLLPQDQSAHKAMNVAYEKFQKNKTEFLNLQKQLSDHQTTLTNAQTQLPLDQAQIPLLTAAIQTADQNFAPVRTTMERLEKELSAIQKIENDAGKEVSRLKTLIPKLEKDVVSLEKEAVSMQKEARSQEAYANEIQPQMERAEREYRMYDVDSEYRSELSHDISYSSAQSRLRFAEMDLSRAESRLRSEESQLRSAESQLHMCESKPDQNCSSEKSAVSSARMQVNMAEMDVRQAESSIRSAESSIRSAEANVMNRVRSEKDRLGFKARGLRNDYEGALDRASYCRQRASDIQKSILPKTKNEIVKNKAALPLAEADYASKQQVTLQKQTEIEQYKISSHYEELKKALADAQQALSQTQKDIVLAGKNIKELPAKITSLQKKINELKPKLTTSEGVYLQAKNKYDNISSQTADAEDKLKNAEQLFAETTEKLEMQKVKAQGIDLYLFAMKK